MYEIRTIIPNEFSIYLRKVLDEAHISWDDVLDKEVNIQQIIREPKDVNSKNSEEKNEKKKLIAESSSSKNLKKRPSKLKFGDSEFYTGRIQYMLPLSTSTSRHNSICSEETNKNFIISDNNIIENTLDAGESDMRFKDIHHHGTKLDNSNQL
jgi:hypothetical protein